MADQTEKLEFVRISAAQNLVVKANSTADDKKPNHGFWYGRPKTRFIKKGMHDYPSEIMDWDTVKAFIDNGLIEFVEYVAIKTL